MFWLIIRRIVPIAVVVAKSPKRNCGRKSTRVITAGTPIIYVKCVVTTSILEHVGDTCRHWTLLGECISLPNLWVNPSKQDLQRESWRNVILVSNSPVTYVENSSKQISWIKYILEVSTWGKCTNALVAIWIWIKVTRWTHVGIVHMKDLDPWNACGNSDPALCCFDKPHCNTHNMIAHPSIRML